MHPKATVRGTAETYAKFPLRPSFSWFVQPPALMTHATISAPKRRVAPPSGLLGALLRGPLLGVALILSSLGGFATASKAQTIEDAVWAAVTLERMLGDRDYPGVLALAALNRLSGGVAGASPAGPAWGPASAQYAEAAQWLAGAVTTFQGVDRCRATVEPLEGVLCSLELLLPQAPSSVALALSSEGRSLLASDLRAQASAQVLDPFQRYTEQVIQQASTLRARMAFLDGEVPDLDPLTLMGRVVGMDPREEMASLLARSRGLQGIVANHASVLAVQGVVTDGQMVLDEYTRYLSTLTGSARGLLDSAQGLEARVEGGVRDAKSWASDRAMLYLTRQAATLAGVEGAVTERIRVLGNAAIDLQAEGSSFVRNLRELGEQTALGLLSGNVLTVATGVAAFLQLTPGAFGPDAARELREIRGLVGALEGEVRAGFDGVDARLDEVFREVESGFLKMEQLAVRNHQEVVAELREIQGGFATLELRTEQFEASVTAYLQAGFDRDHARTLIRCLEHRERFVQPISAPVFRECLTDFRARGARDARDALLSDRTTPVDDASLIRALSDRSLENLSRSLPLVARAAEQRFGYTGLQGGRGGGNPVEWLVSADAYVAMLDDWPELADEVGTADLEALLAVGIELQELLRALVVDPTSGQVGVFHEQVFAAYGRGLQGAVAEADLLARRHQQAQLRRVDPASLLTRAVAERPGGPELPLPRHVQGGIPTEIRTATVLALEAPVLVYRTVHADSVSLENLRRRWTFFGRDHDRITHTRTTLTVELRRASGEVVASWQVTGPPVLRRVEVMAGREGSDQVRSASERVPNVEAHFLQTIYPVLAQNPDEWSGRDPSRLLLREVGSAIEAELRRFESATLNRVFGEVCGMGSMAPPASGAVVSGAVPPPPLDAEDLGAVVRLRRALEEMTVARVMLGAIAGLALPPERQESESLALLLEGSDGLLDRDRLCRIVAMGESPLRVVWLEEVPGERMEGLSGALRSQLDAILLTPAAEGVRPVPRTLVDETVDSLRLAIRIQRLRRSGAP